MGFPTYMDEVDDGAPVPFTGKFLKYHLLKDRLKVVASLTSPSERDAGEEAFLADLQVQLHDINRYFLCGVSRATLWHAVTSEYHIQALRDYSSEDSSLPNSCSAEANQQARTPPEAVCSGWSYSFGQRKASASSESQSTC